MGPGRGSTRVADFGCNCEDTVKAKRGSLNKAIENVVFLVKDRNKVMTPSEESVDGELAGSLARLCMQLQIVTHKSHNCLASVSGTSPLVITSGNAFRGAGSGFFCFLKLTCRLPANTLGGLRKFEISGRMAC